MTAAVDAFVQVRVDSSRLPGKAFLELGGVPCIDHVVARVRRCSEIRHVVLCTSDRPDDAPLEDAARRLGVDCHRGDLDNVIDRYLTAADRFGTEVIVRVTGDSPLIDPGTLDDAIRTLRSEGLDYVHAKALPVGCSAEVLTTAALRRAATAALDASRSEDLTFFVGRSEINAVGEHLPASVLRRSDLVLALNRPEDAAVLEQVLGAAVGAPRDLSLESAIRWLDEHPEVAAANREYVPVPTRCDTRLDPSRLTTSQ
jgi:spore coat polysaccharide biosynthesis protein SpsF